MFVGRTYLNKRNIQTNLFGMKHPWYLRQKRRDIIDLSFKGSLTHISADKEQLQRKTVEKVPVFNILRQSERQHLVDQDIVESLGCYHRVNKVLRFSAPCSDKDPAAGFYLCNRFLGGQDLIGALIV
jgi:hypothetical protein